MRRRKRAYIPYPERLAAALACLLPQDVRAELRALEAPARTVIRLFTNDHIRLHAWGGSDKWWNLHPMMRGPELKKKDAADTSRAAKANRIWRANEEAQRRLLARQQGERYEPKRKHRPMRGSKAHPFQEKKKVSGKVVRR